MCERKEVRKCSELRGREGERLRDEGKEKEDDKEGKRMGARVKGKERDVKAVGRKENEWKIKKVKDEGKE